jgi:hypothetical protein
LQHRPRPSNGEAVTALDRIVCYNKLQHRRSP